MLCMLSALLGYIERIKKPLRLELQELKGNTCQPILSPKL